MKHSKNTLRKLKTAAAKWPRRCPTKFCKTKVYKHFKASHCPKCSSRRFKEKHPLKYFFHHLRARARERGISFSLTYSDYAEFCLKTDYHLLKGKTSLCLSIDRMDVKKGYSKDNIRAITVSANCKRKWVPYLEQLKEAALAASKEDWQKAKDVPF